MTRRSRFRFVLLTVVLLLAISSAVSAHWTVNNVPRSWDDGAGRWENGNLTMYLNSDPQPFYYEFFGNGSDEFDTTAVTNACEGGGSTSFAGQASLALDHTDNTNNAMGFQSTANWALVRCSALDKPTNQTDVKYPAPADILFTCTLDNKDGDIDRCEIITQDIEDTIGCGGNCLDEIITTVQVNLDLDNVANNVACDNTPDANFSSDVCLYWDAVKPPTTQPRWTTPLQVHVRDDQGEMTLNFGKLLGPNAVTLSSFGAAIPGGASLPVAGSVVVALGGLALLLKRRIR